MVLRKWLIALDLKVRSALDKMLPQNLTTRYVAGLGAIAVLAVMGQILIQISLARQTEGQKRIRMLDGQMNIIDNFKKAALELQLGSSKTEVARRVGAVNSLATQLEDSFGMFMSKGSKSTIFSIPVFKLQVSSSGLEDSYARLKRSCHSLLNLISGKGAISSSKESYELTMVAKNLLSDAAAYQNAVKGIIDSLEQLHQHQILDFQRTELILLFLTLLVLVLEGLYVFRPAVERLYEALLIRSDFLSRMSHEIRNPMNSIIGMANLLSETAIHDHQKKYLSILRRSSRGLLDMLNNLLDFSSIESGKIKLEKIPFNLYEALEKSLELAVIGAHANETELIFNLGEDVPLALEGDPSRLQQILSNLLGNAVKFTKRGEVTLQVERLGNDSKPLIQFSVIDTGIGIEKEKLERIFDPFVQADSSVRRKFGGTGLGLSIAKQLVERMGGTLAVKSEKGVGTCFSFAIAIPSVEDSTIDKIIKAQPLGDYDAIIVERNQKIAASLEQIVRSSGGRAIYLTQKKGLIDFSSKKKNQVVFIDYEFAKEEMADVLAKMRRKELEVDRLVFLLKTTASAGVIESLGQYGVKNFLFKPVRPLQALESLTLALSEQGVDPRQSLTESAHPTVSDDRGLKILIADDSSDNLMLLAAYLQSMPYKITFADNGQIAFDKYKEGNFDLVLMDIQMPQLDGYSAAEAIRKWEKAAGLEAVPIVAISAHVSAKDSQRFKNAGFTAGIVKPIDPVELRKLILLLTSGRGRKRDMPISHVAHPIPVEKQIEKLVPLYIENRRKELKDLVQLAQHADFKKIQTIGHRLRGNAASYGFPALAEIGAGLEAAAQERNLERIEGLIQRTSDFLTQLG